MLKKYKVLYRNRDKEVKKRCRNNKRIWFENQLAEAENAAKIGDSKSQYKIVKIRNQQGNPQKDSQSKITKVKL